MTLKDIKLTDQQQEELKNKLDAWKVAERKKMEEELTERYEQMEAELKEESESLVEEVKDNMKKVYSKRFTKALKEMHQTIKAEVMVESMQGPETKALEEVKAIVYPLINESTAKRHTNEFKKLAEMYNDLLEDHEILKGSLKKAELLESLSENTRTVVSKMIGEGSQEEIVEKFAVIKKALKEEVQTQQESELTEDENEDYYSDLNEDIELTTRIDEDIDEDEDDQEEIQESRETIEKRSAFQKALDEQLKLAGLKKIK
jgi:G:T/U-mismatch repair DNA glycosylase